MFSADEVVIHRLSLSDGIGEKFTDGFRNRKIALDLSFTFCADGFFDFKSDILQIDIH